MPELPEVETVKRRLQEVLAGLKIIKIQSLHPKVFLEIQLIFFNLLLPTLVVVINSSVFIWIQAQIYWFI